jgi:chromosome segregation ATPase
MKRKDEPRNISKSELLRKSKELFSERQNLIVQARSLKAEYQRLFREFQPEIDDLQSQADKLANEFRELYRRSQQAYLEDNRALAKSLSIQGHAVQEQCEALNAKANARRDQLKNLQGQIDDLCLRADGLKEEAKKCREKAEELRKTYIRGFEDSEIIDNEDIEEFLDGFSQRIFKEVKKIEYEENLFWESKIRKIKVASRGMVIEDKNNKTVIKIGDQPEEENVERSQKFKEAITHEIGHIIYRRFLTDKQKAEWFVWHTQDSAKMKFISKYSLENEEEDFAENFRMFILEPEGLQNYDERRYNLIKEVMEELEDEKT